MHYNILYYITLYYIILCYVMLYYIVLYCVILYYIIILIYFIILQYCVCLSSCIVYYIICATCLLHRIVCAVCCSRCVWVITVPWSCSLTAGKGMKASTLARAKAGSSWISACQNLPHQDFWIFDRYRFAWILFVLLYPSCVLGIHPELGTWYGQYYLQLSQAPPTELLPGQLESLKAGAGT